MKQDCFELLAGVGYGVFKGFAKKFYPPSEDFFKSMDGGVENISKAAAVAQKAGEAIVDFLVPTRF